MNAANGHVRAVARVAYIFAFPLVLSYADMYAQAIDQSSPSYTRFSSWRHTYGGGEPRHAGSGRVVDSVAWIDVRAEPSVLCTTRGEEGRRVSIRIADLWGHEAHGSTSLQNVGAEESRVIIASPTWVGEIPAGIDHLVRGESSLLRVAISAEVHSDERGRSSKKLHAGCAMGALSVHAAHRASRSPPPMDWVPWAAGDEISNRFWSVASFAMSLVEPHPADEGIMDRIAEIGVAAGEPWGAAGRSVGMLEAISAGMDDALTDLLQAARGPVHLERLGGSRQDYDCDYFGRALSVLIEPSLRTLMPPDERRRRHTFSSAPSP